MSAAAEYQKSVAIAAREALRNLLARHPNTAIAELRELVAEHPSLGSLTLAELVGRSTVKAPAAGAAKSATPKPAARPSKATAAPKPSKTREEWNTHAAEGVAPKQLQPDIRRRRALQRPLPVDRWLRLRARSTHHRRTSAGH